jgi:hypothetical protein
MELLMKAGNRAGKALRIGCALLLGLALGGCRSLAEKAWRALDGSAAGEKTLARWKSPEGFGLRELRKKDGRELLEISHGEFPFLRINASRPGGDGGFYLLSLEFLGPHENGWNEFTLDLSGAGSWEAAGNRGTLRLDSLEPVQISGGKIRYKDERLGGREALTALRNRYERISALAEWMRRREEAAGVLDSAGFEGRWKPLLLPELAGKKKRPPAFAGEEAWVFADGIRWNAAYTRSLLPEELRPLRDSGALLRDWEEAREWLRLFYHWDYLAGILAGGISLEREGLRP